jgi:Cytochrome P460
MNRTFRIKLSVILLLISIIAVSGYSSGMIQPSASPVDQADSTLSSLSKYRTWTLVNPVPVKMEPAVAQLCAAVLRANPHRDKFVSVYGNETGRQAMMTQLRPEFPQGSMIVKEKLGDKESQSPELLTAMIKREKGYNPQSGDWEYLVLDGSASKISERGKLANCSSCHVAYDKSDYVTRTYLSDEVRQQLK